MVEITRRFVGKGLVARLPKETAGTYAYAYQCCFPIESPEFRKPQEVMAWYAGLDQKEKLEFKKVNGFVISQLKVALKDTVVGEEVYIRGEVIEEEDCFRFNFKEAKWEKCGK